MHINLSKQLLNKNTVNSTKGAPFWRIVCTLSYRLNYNEVEARRLVQHKVPTDVYWSRQTGDYVRDAGNILWRPIHPVVPASYNAETSPFPAWFCWERIKRSGQQIRQTISRPGFARNIPPCDRSSRFKRSFKLPDAFSMTSLLRYNANAWIGSLISLRSNAE